MEKRKLAKMNQAARWKEFIRWWDKEFPAGRKLDGWTPYQVVNMIEDKVFELKQGKTQMTEKGKNNTSTERIRELEESLRIERHAGRIAGERCVLYAKEVEELEAKLQAPERGKERERIAEYQEAAGKVASLMQEKFEEKNKAILALIESLRDATKMSDEIVISQYKGLEALRNENRELKSELSKCKAVEFSDEITRLTALLSEAKEVLSLIAAGKRPDGTYNRCREACEQLAKSLLAKLEGEKNG